MSEIAAEQYTSAYLAKLAKAVEESAKLGFKRGPMVDFDSVVSDETLTKSLELISAQMGMFDRLIPGYWGNQCQQLSSFIFASLTHVGIPAEVVIGNVLIQGHDGYEVTLEGLQAEFNSQEQSNGGLRLHAWVSVGGDSIIDAAICPRLVKRFGAPERLADTFLVARSVTIRDGYHLEYQPLLVGGEFFGKTNPPDPIELVKELAK